MASEAPVHEHTDYSDDARDPDPRHSYSASTTNLLTDDDSVLQPREPSTASYYDRAYGGTDHVYGAYGYEDTGYLPGQSSDTFNDKPEVPFGDAPPLEKTTDYQDLGMLWAMGSSSSRRRLTGVCRLCRTIYSTVGTVTDDEHENPKHAGEVFWAVPSPTADSRQTTRCRRAAISDRWCVRNAAVETPTSCPMLSSVWLLTAVMLGVLIYELVVNSRAQGSPVSFKVGRPRASIGTVIQAHA